MPTKIKTKKLVHELTRVSIKLNEVIDTATLGKVTVTNIRAPRHKVGIGRVELKTADGRIGEYSPAVINAIWI